MADNKETQAFAEKVSNIMVTSYTCLGLTIGYEVGLFDILAAQKEPKTSQELADAGNMKERYVREWLGAMVTAQIVELDASGEKYFLPPERVPVLTHDGKMKNALLVAALIPSLGGDTYSQIKECFKKDGPRGMPYSAYSDTCSLFKDMSRPFLQNYMITSTVSPFPELCNRLEKGISALDIGCGYGVSTIEFAKNFPNSTFCGIDFMEDAVANCKKTAEELKLSNITFLAQDANTLPTEWESKFDFVFMHDALHDQAYPDKVLSQVYRVLAPGGIYLALEPFAYSKVKDNLEKLPGTQLLYMISLLHCTPVSLYFEGGMGLGAAWGREKAVEMITAAGLEVCTVAANKGGTGQHFYCKKS